MKASSQTAGWKGMLIKHGEKGLLGLIGVLVLLMMYSGFKKEGLKSDMSPAKLLDRVKMGETHILTGSKMKSENGGDKFNLKPYNEYMLTGLEKLKVEEWPLNIEPPDFPKIAKRSQPVVFPAEEVHATALIVQVALNDPAAVKEQQGIMQNRNDKKQRDDAKKQQALDAKRQADEAKKAKAKAAAQNRPARGNRPGGEGGRPNPLDRQPGIPTIDPPVAAVEIRPPHPATQNLTGITSTTKGIAVVTALIPYKKQIQEFNKVLVEGRDMIPGRKPEDDSPILATFKVERARVANPNEPDDKLQWDDITPEAQNFFTQYGKQLTRSDDPVVLSLHGPDTQGIPKKGVPGWFTVSPLPTLADRKWQREVTHPRIPLITDLTVEEIKVEEANAFVPVAPAANGFGQQVPVMPVEPVEHELPEYVLLRHIDFNVAPGQNYRYRVTLAYQNPNLGLDSKYLDLAASPADILPTTPSKASNTVSLPPLSLIVAGGHLKYPPPKRLDAVPVSKVWHWLIDRRRGGEVAKDFPDISVGDLLDLTGTIKNILNRPAGQPEELTDYNFAQNRIIPGTQMPYLVDVFGKEAPPAPKQPRPVAAKAGEGFAPPVVAAPEPPRDQPYTEILFVDENGKLRSSSSTYAETLIDNYKLRYESMEATPNAPGAAPGLSPPNPGNPLFQGAGLPGQGRNR